jgi:hypothetical protein
MENQLTPPQEMVALATTDAASLLAVVKLVEIHGLMHFRRAARAQFIEEMTKTSRVQVPRHTMRMLTLRIGGDPFEQKAFAAALAVQLQDTRPHTKLQTLRLIVVLNRVGGLEFKTELRKRAGKEIFNLTNFIAPLVGDNAIQASGERNECEKAIKGFARTADQIFKAAEAVPPQEDIHYPPTAGARISPSSDSMSVSFRAGEEVHTREIMNDGKWSKGIVKSKEPLRVAGMEDDSGGGYVWHAVRNNASERGTVDTLTVSNAVGPEYNVAVIGPMKSGKSTCVNAMVGISIAPNRTEAMTQVATKITHVPYKPIPVLKFNPEPYRKAMRVVSQIKEDNTPAGQEAKVTVDSLGGPVQNIYKMIHRLDGELDVGSRDIQDDVQTEQEIIFQRLKEIYDYKNNSTESPMEPPQIVITGPNLTEAEQAIRGWLTTINDICRIASVFHATFKRKADNVTAFKEEPLVGIVLHEHEGLEPQIDDMFANANLPKIEVEMELCKSQPGGMVAEFSLIDTPGPNEASQSELLAEKLKQVLMSSDAVISVVNASNYQDEAQAGVRDMMLGLKKFSEKNMMVLINRWDELEEDFRKDEAAQLNLKQLLANGYYGDKARTDLTLPTSAVQGLEYILMKRLLQQTLVHAPNAPHVQMYSLLKDSNDSVIKSWKVNCYGDDYDHTIERKYKECLKNHTDWLKHLENKNNKRLQASMLQGPKDLLFNNWIRNACDGLIK